MDIDGDSSTLRVLNVRFHGFLKELCVEFRHVRIVTIRLLLSADWSRMFMFSPPVKIETIAERWDICTTYRFLLKQKLSIREHGKQAKHRIASSIPLIQLSAKMYIPTEAAYGHALGDMDGSWSTYLKKWTGRWMESDGDGEPQPQAHTQEAPSRARNRETEWVRIRHEKAYLALKVNITEMTATDFVCIFIYSTATAPSTVPSTT